jgi:outer membrane biosynthesis protein TonB
MLNQVRRSARSTTALAIAATFCLTAAAMCQAPQPGVSATRIVAMEYPPFARMAYLRGTVDLVATISREGTVAAVRVVSGPPMLATPAKENLSKWRFTGCASPTGQCEAKLVFSFVLLPGSCDSDSHCPSEFEVDLPNKVLLRAQPFKAIVD